VKVGDLVKQSMTEQLGVVVRIGEPAFGCPASVRVLWTTQGLSMWVGNKTWESARTLEVISGQV